MLRLSDEVEQHAPACSSPSPAPISRQPDWPWPSSSGSWPHPPPQGRRSHPTASQGARGRGEVRLSLSGAQMVRSCVPTAPTPPHPHASV